MRLLISDLTDMSTGNFCVAGWDLDARRMVRPLPDGHHWHAALVEQHGVCPGVTIEVVPTGRPHPGSYPHLTEDTEVHSGSILVIDRGPFDWFGPTAPATDKSIDALFAGAVANTNTWNGYRKGCYVTEGQNVRSLGAILIQRECISIYENDYQGKLSLRARLRDGNGAYDIPVVDSAMKAAYRASGELGATRHLPRDGRLHVRVGLARSWPVGSGHCALMLNGVRW